MQSDEEVLYLHNTSTGRKANVRLKWLPALADQQTLAFDVISALLKALG